MKVLVAMSVVVGMIAEPAMLTAKENPKAGRAQKTAVEHKSLSLQDLVLTGKIAKEEKKNQDGAKTLTAYVLTTADGRLVNLPSKAGPVIKLDEYLNTTVKVTAKGRYTTRGDKDVLKVNEIVNIEKVTEVPMPAPAAP
jgi:hypothetical protein